MEKYKKHLGVYGIYQKSGKLLVVHKKRGPYSFRYDLPGGSLEEGESELDSLNRELLEEVGYNFHILNQIGVCDYLIPWQDKDYTHLHHIAMYWHIDTDEALILTDIVADDTSGFSLVDITTITTKNASPLVMEAINIIKGHALDKKLKRLHGWVTYKEKDA